MDSTQVSIGLAKSAEASIPASPVTHAETPKNSSISNEVTFMGVPTTYYTYFNVDMGRIEGADREKLGFINGWLGESTSSLGDRLIKLKEIERKIGMSGFDSRISKVYNYMRISSQISDFEKQRKALEN